MADKLIAIKVKVGKHLAGVGTDGSTVSGPAWTFKPEEAERNNSLGVLWVSEADAYTICEINGDATVMNPQPKPPAEVAAEKFREKYGTKDVAAPANWAPAPEPPKAPDAPKK